MNPEERRYYDARAAEYDDWWLGRGLFAARERPGWHDERRRLERFVAALPPARTLDVACGTGFLTRHLAGEVTGLDQSAEMTRIAAVRYPRGRFIRGDALALPFRDATFDVVLTAHFYGHLGPADRKHFLAQARRVASRIIVVDSALRPGVAPEETQERVLNDGSRHAVYKRYFTADALAGELDGVPLFRGTWFVAAAAPG